MFLIHKTLLEHFSCDGSFLFSSSSCFCHAAPSSFAASARTRRATLINGSAASREETADKEVIREDESVVFTPLLCNNKDRRRCGTKGNDGLYTEHKRTHICKTRSDSRDEAVPNIKTQHSLNLIHNYSLKHFKLIYNVWNFSFFLVS